MSLTLRAKTLLITVLFATLLIAMAAVISSLVVIRGFSNVEEVSIRRDIARARNALQNDIDDLASKVADWAVWDDSYEFIANPNPEFIASNLGGSVFADLQLSAVLFINQSNEVAYSQGFDLKENERVPVSEDLLSVIKDTDVLTTHTDWTDTKEGIIMLTDGPMMIVSRPVVTSLGEGPIRGTVIFARELSDKEIARLSQVSHLAISRIPLQGVFDNGIEKLSLTQIAGTAIISDIFGSPAFALRVVVIRDIYGQGLASLRVFLLALLFGVSGFSILLFLVLRWLVIERITLLSKQVADIGSQADFSKRVDVLKTNDEITQLAETFNFTLDEFEQSRSLLVEAKAKDDAILGSMGEGVVVVDKSGNLTYWNDTAKQLLGIEKKSRNKGGKVSLYPILDPETGKAFSKTAMPLARALHGESVTKAEIVIMHTSSEKEIRASVNARPVRTPEGKTLGAVATFRDISHEKEIDKAKTEFVSLASHQLRTPLSAIAWYIEMLLSGDAGKLTTQQKKYLTEAYAGNIRMGELVNALLNVSRLELGTFAVEPEKTDVVAVAKSVVSEMKPVITKKKQKVSIQSHGEIPEMMLDPKLIRIVIQNLVSNAVKYTLAKGSIKVEFSLAEEGDSFQGKIIPVKSLVFSVSDSGIGIPKKDQEKIFTKLFRAGNVTKTDTEGTGLGLYIVKSVVEVSGGIVWFESKEGKGTTFSATIPFHGMKKKAGTRKLS